MEFQVVTFAVSDLTESKRFYEGILGFEPTVAYARWQGYAVSGDHAGFGINEEPDLRRLPASDIVNFAVDDLDALWERIREHVRVELPPTTMPWGTRKFVILDPDGLRIGFTEKPKPTPGDPGPS